MRHKTRKGDRIMRKNILGSKRLALILALVVLTVLIACQDTKKPKTEGAKTPAVEKKAATPEPKAAPVEKTVPTDKSVISAPAAKLPTTTQAEADAFLAKLAPGADYFTCPMHPEVVTDKVTDTCPKCGMKLDKKQKAATPAAAAAKPAPEKPVPADSAVKLPTTTQAEADAFLAKLAPGADYFTCPMHPEVVTDKATDTCPKCGMKLEKKQKAA
jgi:hypothetical protein